MSEYNYCLIKKNKIYEQIYDMLEIEELSMSNPDHDNKIIYELEKIIKKAKFIEIKKSESNKDDLLAEMMIAITSEHEPGLQGNTMLLHANDDYYYEVIYMENPSNKNFKKDEHINEFASISNIELEPIMKDCVFVKTGYTDGVAVCKAITIDDICEILINNFYHKGILIEDNGKIIEITYSGDNPTIVLGNKFQKGDTGDVLGLTILPWVEPNENKNEIASKILGTSIKGRVFLMTFSPISCKRHWSLSKETIDNILKVLDNKEKINKVYDEIDKQNKQVNPFYLIKKVLNENN